MERADAEKEVRPLLGFPLAETMASGDASTVVEDAYGEIVQAVVEGFESGELAKVVADGEFKGWMMGVGKALGRKGKRLFMPMRIALTGRMQGPDVGEVLSILALAEGQVAEEGALMLLPERVAALKAWAAAEAEMLQPASASA
jgi:glutamyl-tRNA synthetase